MPDVQRVSRLDLSTLAQTRRTPQGGLVVSARCARTGVQEYRQADGSVRREYRPPEEVFDPASLETFRLGTLTVGHPSMVTAENWRDVAVGHVGPDPREDAGKFIAADLYVQDAGAASGVEGKRLSELSCGYTCDLEMTPGVSPEGQAYDAIQRKIRHNHLALLPPGTARGGPELRIRLDSAGAAYLDGMADKADEKPEPGKKPGVTVEIHNHEHDHKHDEKHEHEHDHALYVAEKKKADTLDGENAALKAQVTKLTADATAAADPKRIDAAVAARFALVEIARKLLDGAARSDGKGKDPWDPTGKSDADIRRAILGKLTPDVKYDGKSEEFLLGAFEAAVKAAEAQTSRADARDRSVQGSAPRVDSMHSDREHHEPDMDKVKDSRDAMIQRMKDRGRKPDKRDRRGKDGDDKHGKDARH